jgi:hypothetical protein
MSSRVGICMHIYVYVCMHIYTHVCRHLYTCAYMHTSLPINLSVSTHTSINLSVSTHTSLPTEEGLRHCSAALGRACHMRRRIHVAYEEEDTCVSSTRARVSTSTCILLLMSHVSSSSFSMIASAALGRACPRQHDAVVKHASRTDRRQRPAELRSIIVYAQCTHSVRIVYAQQSAWLLAAAAD